MLIVLNIAFLIFEKEALSNVSKSIEGGGGLPYQMLANILLVFGSNATI